VVSDAIIENPVTYNSAILGKDPFEYCEWIRRDNSWGGGIELAVFADYFQVEITSVDISTGRMDRFGQDKYSTRAFVMYRFDAI
jgi:ubiquitin thioesterase OTU1